MNTLEEIERLKLQIKSCRSKLLNPDFIEKAPDVIIEREKEKLRDFSEILSAIKSRLLVSLEVKYGNVEWEIENQREMEAAGVIDLCSEKWFDYVYNDEIDVEELAKLLEQ
jgi:hypothetical protein